MTVLGVLEIGLGGGIGGDAGDGRGMARQLIVSWRMAVGRMVEVVGHGESREEDWERAGEREGQSISEDPVDAARRNSGRTRDGPGTNVRQAMLVNKQNRNRRIRIDQNRPEPDRN